VTLNLAETSLAKSRPSFPYGANLFHFWLLNDIFLLQLFVMSLQRNQIDRISWISPEWHGASQ